MSLPVPSSSLPLGITNIHDDGVVVPLPVNQTTTPVGPPPYEFFLKVFAIGSNIALQLSPLRLMMDIQLLKSVGDFSAFPLVALTACGFQWSFYGYYAYSVSENAGFLMLLYANILGLILGGYYLAIYHWNDLKHSSSSLGNQIWILCALFAAEVTYCQSGTDPQSGLLLSGVLSAILSILVSASPMVAIPKILLLKSTKTCLPTDMVLASLLSSVLWLWCGYLLRDPWVWMPNLCGVIVGSVQVGIILYYYIAWRQNVGKLLQVYGNKRDEMKMLVKRLFKPKNPSTGETE